MRECRLDRWPPCLFFIPLKTFQIPSVLYSYQCSQSTPASPGNSGLPTLLHLPFSIAHYNLIDKSTFSTINGSQKIFIASLSFFLTVITSLLYSINSSRGLVEKHYYIATWKICRSACLEAICAGLGGWGSFCG